MNTTTIIIAAIIAAGVAAAVGAAILIGLAAGTNGPRRFRLRPPSGVATRFIDREASWAATAEITSPASAEAIWNTIDSTDYLSRLPLASGPAGPADSRATRLTLVSVEERVADRRPQSELITVGTGISVPLVVSAFAQRFTVEPSGTQTVVRWTVAVTPQWVGFLPLRWTGFLARPVMKIVLKSALAPVANRVG